jgi:tetratricopeptide (TPR) repeat protein
VSEELQKKVAFMVKEKGKFGLALALVAAVLLALQFPGYILVFLAVTTFFIWKAFAPARSNSVRGIFEFYLAANELLRDDDRRWFGFEMREVLHSGERILNSMPDAPPLMLFTLGALHHKARNYDSAIQYLRNVLENDQMDESRRLIASPELKNYVRILRRIEREPSDAPQTSAAIRALERARRNRAQVLLDDSRRKLQELKDAHAIELAEKENATYLDLTTSIVDADASWSGDNVRQSVTAPETHASSTSGANGYAAHGSTEKNLENPQPATPVETTNGRKPISEVLKDIYGR